MATTRLDHHVVVVGESSSARNYDAFLSFRGDIRDDFADRLYHELTRTGMHTFRDCDEIEKGAEFELEIEKAIGESKVAVIIFSADFASSTYCLDEVSMFMDRRRRGEVEVLPVFFKVDPDDVRELKGTYGTSFKRHSKLKKERKGWNITIPWRKRSIFSSRKRVEGNQEVVELVQQEESKRNLVRWRDALREVAQLTGHVYTQGYQSDFIKTVVDDALRLANPVTLYIPSKLVGKPNRYSGLEEWVRDQSHGKRIALLHGAHGIGKKTIAAVVSRYNYKDFEAMVFLDNVAEKSKQPDSIAKLQSQLYSRLCNRKMGSNDSRGESERKARIVEGLKNKRSLIVLADLDEAQQLFDLIEDPRNLKEGSKVIVTSVDSKLLGDRHCVKFLVEALTLEESRELFSWHAFGANRVVGSQGRIMPDISYCCGVPLFLRAFAYLFNHLDEQCIPGIQMLGYVMKARHCLNSLEDNDKKLFFDIACFYSGRDCYHLNLVLDNCREYKSSGFGNLQARHLVSVDQSNKVTMNQPTIDMGREIIRLNNTQYVEDRSHIWHSEDAKRILEKCNGTKYTRSFIIDGEQVDSTENEFRTKALGQMTDLKLLQLLSIKLKGDYKYFPKDLVWLTWEGFSLHQIPDAISLQDLVILDLRNTSLRQLWNGSPPLKKLKILNLHSLCLERTPDFSCLHLPNLERLSLEYCTSLVEIHPSIGELTSLVQLSLKGCTGLEELRMPPVKLLDISGCTGLRTMPNQRIESVEELYADEIDVDRLSFGFSFSAVFPCLVKLSLVNCKLSDKKIIADLNGMQLLRDLDIRRTCNTPQLAFDQ